MTDLMNQAKSALANKNWDLASKLFEEVLSNDSENAEAYLGAYMATDRIQAKNFEVLKDRIIHRNLPQNDYYDFALKYASGEMVEMLTSWEEEKKKYQKQKEIEKKISLSR